MTTAHQPDGDLRTARKHLADAIHRLTGRTRYTIDRDPDGEHRTDPRTHTTVAFGDSLYTQLRDMIAGAQGTQLGSTARSMPPLWVDAADVLTDIDTTIAAEQPDPGIFDGDLSTEPTADTIRRLHLIDDRTWRPQDVTHIEHLTDLINGWVTRIEELFDPPERRSLPNPCPACNTKVVYRRDSAGESVRQPALQIGVYGCECLHCHTVWGPDYFTHLARVLGYDRPAGVLE